MASTRLAPGFRFHPTDVELIMYYLKRKVMGKKIVFEAISEINIYKYPPWDLPDKSSLKIKDSEWFFFCPNERKHNRGGRVNRATGNGYWKITGKDRAVHHNDRIVGMVRSLVFHIGHSPKGQRTDWVIHEYRMQDQHLLDAGVAQDAFVLCKLFHKSGPGPKKSSQSGESFEEEEWDNESPEYLDFPSADPSVSYTVTHPLSIPGSSVLISSVPPVNEDIPAMADRDSLQFSSLTGEAIAIVQDDNSHEKLDHNNDENNVGVVACMEGNDIYNGLPDLFNLQAMANQESCSFSTIQPYADTFLELGDLDIPLNSVNDL